VNFVREVHIDSEPAKIPALGSCHSAPSSPETLNSSIPCLKKELPPQVIRHHENDNKYCKTSMFDFFPEDRYLKTAIAQQERNSNFGSTILARTEWGKGASHEPQPFVRYLQHY
jgi:hypothetical protein